MTKETAAAATASSENNIAKILAKAAVSRPNDYPRWASSPTGGVIPMSIESRFANERERLGPDFNDKWRKWRVQWIKDQELHPSEPIHVPQLKLENTNPIRRFYQRPLNYVEENWFKPRMGAEAAKITRGLIAKILIGYYGCLVGWYAFKYNQHSWEKVSGWKIYTIRDAVLPGDAAYPLANPRPNKADFEDRGFSKRKVFLE